MEIWKDIKGYEGKYQVSNQGRVKSLERTRFCKGRSGKIAIMKVPERILKQWKRSTYLLVDLWKDRKRDIRSVHILVYEAFVGKIPIKHNIHHLDNDKYNNCVENLQCLSIKDHLTLHNGGVCRANDHWTPSKKHEACVAGWITRKKNLHLEERNYNILMDRLEGIGYKGLSKKYNLCSRQIYDILRRGKDDYGKG